MRVGFYAPLKPPQHAVPSGDRRMARLLMRALSAAGHQVELMSSLRTYCASPDEIAQVHGLADAAARRLIAMLPVRPRSDQLDAWLTYHLYYKAPDWIGPAVASSLGIPYLVAEASSAPKHAADPWAPGERAAAAALRRADAVLSLNPADDACVSRHLDRPDRILPLLPFLDLESLSGVPADRARISAHYGVADDAPWLLAVGMMREGDKLASYRMLGAALRLIDDLPWRLIVAGDGPARDRVEAALGPRARLLGACDADALQALYVSTDLLVWPAINEAFGMVLLEARAAGLPVIAGDQGAVATIVDNGNSGLVVSPVSAGGLAGAIRALLTDSKQRNAMAGFARRSTRAKHGLDHAAATLDKALHFAAAHRREAQPFS